MIKNAPQRSFQFKLCFISADKVLSDLSENVCGKGLEGKNHNKNDCSKVRMVC